tara:strand:+ start:49 stop:1362 length:1314 start_codon:yes stop_codon:yes gene_type:complete
MAIEQLGESLLSEKRKRDEDQARKLRRREERNALLGLAGAVGIGLYRSNLQKKQQAFMNSEGVMNARIQYNHAERIAKAADAERQKYMASGGIDNYYYNSAFDDIKQEYLTKYSDDLDRVAYINAGKEDAVIARDARAVAVERSAAQKAREDFADRFRAQGSFEDVLKMTSKRPDSAFKGFINFLNGTSNEELDRRSIQALRESSLGRLALPASPNQQSEAIRLQEAYDLTGSIIEAQDLADLGQLERDTRKEVTFQGGFNATTGKYNYSKQIKQFDRITGEELKADLKRVESADMDDQEAVEKIALRNAKTSFNPIDKMTVVFNDAGSREFQRRLGAANISMNIDTLDKYNKALEIFYEVGQAKTDSQNNPVDYITAPSQEFTAIQEAVLKSQAYQDRLAIANELMFGDGATDDDKRNGRTQYFTIMQEIADLGKL